MGGIGSAGTRAPAARLVLTILLPTLLVAGAIALLLGQPVLRSLLPHEPNCVATARDGSRLLAGPPDEVARVVNRALSRPASDRSLAAHLGRGPALACSLSAPWSTQAQQKDLPVGLTERAAAMRNAVRDVFGDLPDGGYGPEEVLPGRRAGGEHSLGRAVDFFFRPHEAAGSRVAGWQLANWAVANAQRLEIATVIYRDHIWTARRSAEGWRDYRFRGPDPDNPINRHLDHVHVDVR